MKKKIIAPHCDCPESSEALGLPVGKKAWSDDFHKMTPTEIIRETYCKYCGNHVFWRPIKNSDLKRRVG